jgi:hypothetical protein
VLAGHRWETPLVGSAPVLFWCPFCEVTFERDASGMPFEIDD